MTSTHAAAPSLERVLSGKLSSCSRLLSRMTRSSWSFSSAARARSASASARWRAFFSIFSARARRASSRSSGVLDANHADAETLAQSDHEPLRECDGRDLPRSSRAAFVDESAAETSSFPSSSRSSSRRRSDEKPSSEKPSSSASSASAGARVPRSPLSCLRRAFAEGSPALHCMLHDHERR